MKVDISLNHFAKKNAPRVETHGSDRIWVPRRQPDMRSRGMQPAREGQICRQKAGGEVLYLVRELSVPQLLSLGLAGAYRRSPLVCFPLGKLLCPARMAVTIAPIKRGADQGSARWAGDHENRCKEIWGVRVFTVGTLPDLSLRTKRHPYHGMEF